MKTIRINKTALTDADEDRHRKRPRNKYSPYNIWIHNASAPGRIWKRNTDSSFYPSCNVSTNYSCSQGNSTGVLNKLFANNCSLWTAKKRTRSSSWFWQDACNPFIFITASVWTISRIFQPFFFFKKLINDSFLYWI